MTLTPLLLLSLLVLVVQHASGSTLFPPNTTNFQYIGRVDKSDSSVYKYDWANVQVVAVFSQSTTISVMLQDDPSVDSYWGRSIYYLVFIDGNLVLDLNSSVNTQQQYVLASNLTTGSHTIRFQRRNEPSMGTSGFLGFLLDEGGNFESPPSRSDRRIEFIGDSITCGWGDMGVAPCSDQPQLEDSTKSWVVQTAESLQADYFVESWSGQGMVRYYGCKNTTCPGAFPSVYNRTRGFVAEPLWDFEWIPQAFVITLSANDYGSPPTPSFEEFSAGYVRFVQDQLVPHYGKSFTLFTSCYFNGPSCDSVKYTSANLTSLGFDVMYIPLNSMPPVDGCDYHPNAATHAEWAKYVAPVIGDKMGWN